MDTEQTTVTVANSHGFTTGQVVDVISSEDRRLCTVLSIISPTTITIRDATRWERVKYRLSRTWRWSVQTFWRFWFDEERYGRLRDGRTSNGAR